MGLHNFNKKFKVKEFKIYESNHWIWSLRPHQATIGAGILSLKRECANFGKLKPYEFTDLHNIIGKMERTLKLAFNYDEINYLMLMMIDKHVHYHVFPRYKNSIEILGRTWNDENWPAIPTLMGEQLSGGKLQEITLFIKSKI